MIQEPGHVYWVVYARQGGSEVYFCSGEALLIKKISSEEDVKNLTELIKNESRNGWYPPIHIISFTFLRRETVEEDKFNWSEIKNLSIFTG